MAEELNDQERHETELWQVLDWSLWGNGLGDVLRTAMADVMVSALSGEQREQAEACIKAWHAGRGPSMAVGEGTELAKRVAYLEARVGELNNTIGELRAESENRLQVGDRLGWRLVEAQQEIERLRREVEFEANAEPFNHDWMNFSLRPCACLTASFEVPAGWSVPQCAVHPEGGTP
jgi:hypothetical protein